MPNPRDNEIQFINNINSSLKKVLQPSKPNTTSKNLIDGISNSLIQILEPSKPNTKSKNLIDGMSKSLIQILEPSTPNTKSETNTNIKRELSKPNIKSETNTNIKREPRLFSKPKTLAPSKKITEQEKLGIQDYIHKLKEIIESLNDIIIDEKIYDKNKLIVNSQTNCFDDKGNKVNCKKKSANENESINIISTFKDTIDDIINSDINDQKNIDDVVNDTSKIINESTNKEEIITNLNSLTEDTVVIKTETEEKKYDKILNIIKKLLDRLLTKN